MESAGATIIAGRFEQKDRAEALVGDFARVGFSEERCTCFFVNPPGHHDRTPIGGDQDESPGAKDADRGALAGVGVGGAIGLGVGLAATPVVGPVAVAAGVGVGAYVGSLAGALGKMGNKDVPLRKSGFLVAVQVNDMEDERTAVHMFQIAGACEIERAHGRWEAGRWADFDPTRLPALIASH